MSTAVTMAWRTTFYKSSVVGMEAYYIEFGADTPQSVLRDLRSQLATDGYTRINTRLVITFPP